VPSPPATPDLPVTDSEPPVSGSWGDWLSDKAIRALLRRAMAMPWERRVPFMGRTLARVVGPAAGYRRRAMANLALIHPQMSQPRRREIADAVLDNFGRTLIENYSWREFGPRLAGNPAHGAGLDALDDARTAGRPVIFVTGHFGNHEAPRQVLTAMGHQIGGLYRAMDNPYFNAHYAATMTGLSGPVFPKGKKGTMGFARHLRAGGMATILFDIHDRGGTAIPFLGRPALTSLSAATLALRFDAVLIPYFGTRQPDGLTFDVQIEPPIPPSDPLTMTAEATRRLEAHVTAHPAQWFWVHRRWKPARPPRAG
jgi:KDO2-lipid IV(A) lauroyltransferase